MRTILLISVGLLISLQAHSEPADTCNWGHQALPRFVCEGQFFVYGTATCTSGFYSKVFCHASQATTGKKCGDDKDPVTLRCREMLVGSKPDTSGPVLDSPSSANSKQLTLVPTPPAGGCSPGIAPGRYHMCNGKRYFYDSAACGSDGKHHKIFCAEEFSNDVEKCRLDNSAGTLLCKEELIGNQPVLDAEAPAAGLRSKTPIRGAQ